MEYIVIIHVLTNLNQTVTVKPDVLLIETL